MYRAYGHNNRTLMCRLPVNRRCLELRIADSACNFYLGTALTLAAGLDGIQRRAQARRPGQRRHLHGQRRGARARPGSAGSRPPSARPSTSSRTTPLAKEVFGAELHATYVAYKRDEWHEYNTVVSEWEREHYLHLW